MKTNKYLFFLMTLGLLLTHSCTKEEPIVSQDNTNVATVPETITLEENILSFDSKETLTALLENDNEGILDQTMQSLSDKGFTALRPIFTDLDGPEVESFLAHKASLIQSKGILYSTRGNDAELDLDDEVISDGKFAKVLNENRELIVGNNYYVYTTNGLYFCEKSKKETLQNYLVSLSTDKNFKPYERRSCGDENMLRSSGDVLQLAPIEGEVKQVTSEINQFVSSCSGGGGGGTGGGTGGSSGGSSSSSTPPILIPQSFGQCTYSEDSIFQKIFGNTVKCNDYHDSTHRIQTKVWNENYFLWSSVGVSAKYQKKRFIGWSESSTSDGVRLGLNHAIYTYKSPMSPYNTHDPKRVIFKYKGVNYNQNGQVVTSYPINSSVWPFPQNETLGAIEIYIFGDDRYWPLTGKDANKTINQLLSQARGAIRGLSNDMNNDKVGIQVVKFLPTSFRITQADVLLKHRSQAKRTLDFNFLLKFKSGNSDIFQNVVNQLNAEKYDKIEIDMYGAALRNGKWKGKRIIGKVD